MPLNSASAPISAARSAAAESVVKNGLPVPPAKMTTLPCIHVGGRLALREAFAKLGHGDCRQHDGIDAELDQRGAQRQRIDDGGKHAHVVAGDAVAALGGHRNAAKDVAAANDHADLDAKRPRLGDVGGDAIDDRDVYAEMLFAHQRFARRFQQNSSVQWLGRHDPSRLSGSLDIPTKSEPSPVSSGTILRSLLWLSISRQRTGQPASKVIAMRIAIHEGRRDVTRRPVVQKQQEALMRRYFLTAAATSAAKSDSSFSMPSPSAKRTKPVIAGRRADLLFGVLQRLLDGDVGIDHESLLQEDDFLVELAQPAFDHLLDDVLGLAGLARLIGKDRPFALDRGRIDLIGRQCKRVGRGDMHGHLPAEGACGIGVAGRFR